jgi:cell division septation protein DedD
VRYRHAWPGFLLLGSLAVLLASLVVWGDLFLTPSSAGGIGRLLQLRLAPVGGLEASPPAASHPSAEDAVVRLEQPATDPELNGESVASFTPSVASRSRAATQARYALELGTFAIEEDAERAEVQLNHSGFSTVRFRQQAPARLYSVFIRRLDSSEWAQAAPEQSMQEDFPQATRPGEDGATMVRVAQALALRSAVQLAERLQASGYEVHVVAEAVTAGRITLRHGNFASRREAEIVSREISRMGVPNEVVRVR